MKSHYELLIAENQFGVGIAAPASSWPKDISVVIENQLDVFARREYLRDQHGWFWVSAEVDDVLGELNACLREEGFEVELTAKVVDAEKLPPVVRVSVDEGVNFSDLTIQTMFTPSRNRVARLVQEFATSFGAARDELGNWYFPSPTLFGWADVGLLELVDTLEAAGAVVLEDSIWHEQN